MSGARTKLVQARISVAAHERLAEQARALGLPSVSALVRQRLEIDEPDGRAAHAAAFRAAVRGVLREQLDATLEQLAGELTPQRTAALAACAISLGLDRPLSHVEAGVVTDCAAAELAIRRDPTPDED